MTICIIYDLTPQHVDRRATAAVILECRRDVDSVSCLDLRTQNLLLRSASGDVGTHQSLGKTDLQDNFVFTASSAHFPILLT